MAWDPSADIALRGSHTPGVGAGESRATTATGGVEGASAAAAADTDRPDFLGSAVEAVDGLAAFAAAGAAGDGGPVAPARISTLLGMEESATIRSAHDQYGAARSDSADELRQSSLGCAENPRRAAEARPIGLAGDGVEVHDSGSTAAVAGVADVLEESCRASNRVGFLHGAHGDVSSSVRARDTDAPPAPAGPFQCDGPSDGGMDGAATA